MTPFDKDVTVHVTDSALMHLLLAGMESYRAKRHGALETGGLLWGFIKDETDSEMDHITIEHVSTDTYAKRKPDSVALSDRTTSAKRDVIEQRWPHLSMIGDFHTHPYTNYTEAVDNKGWEFSRGDFEWYENGHTAESWAGRVGLVLAIAGLQRYHKDNHATTRVRSRYGNTLQWQLGRYRFWLSAYSVDPLEGRLIVSPRGGANPSRRYVYIDVPTINGTDAWFTYE
ncbi:MAG: hypothetical protein OXH15_05095 [Gammaproteobacteria bacterium]|nr:hypothetical protein [Gammaproteobacteria bacterium]